MRIPNSFRPALLTALWHLPAKSWVLGVRRTLRSLPAWFLLAVFPAQSIVPLGGAMPSARVRLGTLAPLASPAASVLPAVPAVEPAETAVALAPMDLALPELRTLAAGFPAAPQQAKRASSPLPPPTDISGSYSTSTDQLQLAQNGTDVTGTWLHLNGNLLSNLRGTLIGDTLWGTWEDARKADPVANRGIFTLTFTADPSGSGQAASCSGYTGTSDFTTYSPLSCTRQAAISVQVVPASASLAPGGSQSFLALVSGSTNKAVTWTTTGGSLDAAGNYLAPAVPGTYTVTATSVASPSASSTATVSVVPTVTAGMDLTGSYATTDGFLRLYQSGTQVYGDWDGNGGYGLPGGTTWVGRRRVTGVALGQTLVASWLDEGKGTTGQVTAQFAPDISSFQGSWGTGTDCTTSPWNGTRQSAQPVPSAKISPASLVLAPAANTTFQAFNAGLGTSPTSWMASGGSITAAGVYTAPSVAGGYLISLVRSSDNLVLGTAAVLVPGSGTQDISGTYIDNTGFPLVLFQDGRAVWGTYVYGYKHYRIDGVLNGATLTGTLNQTDGAETYTITLTFSADGLSFSGGMSSWRPTWTGTVTVGTVALQVLPTPIRLNPGAIQTFQAFVGGTPNRGVSWSCLGGTISSSGVFTAPSAPGSYTVTATSLADSTASGATTFLVPVPAGSLDVTGPYSASFGNLIFTQSGTNVTGSGSHIIQGTLSGSVLTGKYYNTGSNTPAGNIQFTWNAGNTGFTGLYGPGTATPSYPWNGTRLIGVQVNPAAAELRVGQTLSCTALVTGTSNLGVTWTSTAGTVAPDGTFTAPATPGVVTVTATSQASATVKGTATVSVGTTDPLAVTTPPDLNGTYTTTMGTLQFFPVGATAWGLMTSSSNPSWFPSPPYRLDGKLYGTTFLGTIAAASTASNPMKVQFTFSADGSSFTGTWGINGSYNSQGAWNGTRNAGVTVAFVPGNPKVQAGGTLQLQAWVGGTSNKALTWTSSAGSIDANGQLTAPTSAGTITVTATSVADPSKSASVSVEVFTLAGMPDLSGVYQCPQGNLTLFQNGSQVWGWWVCTVFGSPATTYRVQGTLNGRSLIGIWGAVLGDSNPNHFLLSFSPDGLAFTGGYGANGAYTTWGSWTGTRTSTVVVAPTPAYRAVPPGGRIQLAAAVGGSANKGVIWSADQGSVDANGLLTAPAAPWQGLITVTATSAAVPAAFVTIPVEVIPQTGWDASGGYNTYPASYSVATTSTTGTPSGNQVAFQSGPYFWGTWNNQDLTPDRGLLYLAGQLQGRVFSGFVGGARPEDQTPITIGFAPGWKSFQAWFRGPYSAATWPGTLRAGEVAVQVQPGSTTLPAPFVQGFLAFVAGTLDKRVSWTASAGTVSADGAYTPPGLAGLYTVTANSVADPSKSASASVKVPVQVKVAPGFAELRPGSTQQLSATVISAANPAVSWSVQEGSAGGSVSSAGLYAAPAVPGTYHVVATSVADPTAKAIAAMQVGAALPLNVSMSPYAVQLGKGGTITFAATVEGSSNQAVTWSVLGTSGGTITAAGVYTAPMVFGTYTVQATSVEYPSAWAIATVVVAAQAGQDTTFTYDANGNMTSDGSRSFEWDAENRLIAVNILASGHRSEFGYDEMGRRVLIRELDPVNTVLTETSNKKYLWDGVEIAEERSTDGSTVLRRFYSQGFVDTDGTALFYTRDHLGSIRELTDSTQAVRARYDYDPYGRMTKISGDRDSFLGYTGLPWHQASGINLAVYRAYDPNLGRWINRDPIEEHGGDNLYQYCENKPISNIDRLGLEIDSPLPGRDGFDVSDYDLSCVAKCADTAVERMLALIPFLPIVPKTPVGGSLPVTSPASKAAGFCPKKMYLPPGHGLFGTGNPFRAIARLGGWLRVPYLWWIYWKYIDCVVQCPKTPKTTNGCCS